MKKFLLFVILLIQSFISFAQVGSLDPGFGATTGKVAVPFPSAFAGANSIAIQSDGKIVAGGFHQPGGADIFTLVRLNSDGSLDALGFDGDGKVTTDIDPLAADVILSIAIQTDGKIVAGGYSVGGSGFRFALARYNTDGSLDGSFNTTGTVITPVGSAGSIIYSIALQPDGKILAAGLSNNGVKRNVAIARYNTNGSLDGTFDNVEMDGIVSTPIGSSDDTAYSVMVLPGGKILIAGSSKNGTTTDFALARYNSDGSLDGSFDMDGIVTTDFSTYSDLAYSIALQADGKYVIAGSSYNGTDLDFALARYNTDGSLDAAGFGSGGKLTTAVGSLSDQAQSVALQADGKIIVAGTSQATSINSNFAMVRYNINGSLDTDFDTDGIVTTDMTTTNELGISLKLVGMRIYLAGTSFTGQGFLFAAYINDALPLALPLKLRKFTGTRKNNTVLLQWQTDLEQNTSHFIIQRSAEGMSFADIASITAAGNSNTQRSYEFTDASPLKGIGYYRLRQIDLDGRFTYSPVIKMVTEMSDMVFSLSPNPATSFLNINYPGKLDNVRVTIYDNQGKLILQQTRKNEIPIRVELKPFKEGLYFIQLTDGETTRQGKFFKK